MNRLAVRRSARAQQVRKVEEFDSGQRRHMAHDKRTWQLPFEIVDFWNLKFPSFRRKSHAVPYVRCRPFSGTYSLVDMGPKWA